MRMENRKKRLGVFACFARYAGKGRFGHNNDNRCGADSSRTIRIRRG